MLIPWQHLDYRTLTALSLGLRPRESGQLSTIIPHNHGITTTETHKDIKIRLMSTQYEGMTPLIN